jgi:hypothetical protein
VIGVGEGGCGLISGGSGTCSFHYYVTNGTEAEPATLCMSKDFYWRFKVRTKVSSFLELRMHKFLHSIVHASSWHGAQAQTRILTSRVL